MTQISKTKGFEIAQSCAKHAVISLQISDVVCEPILKSHKHSPSKPRNGSLITPHMFKFCVLVGKQSNVERQITVRINMNCRKSFALTGDGAHCEKANGYWYCWRLSGSTIEDPGKPGIVEPSSKKVDLTIFNEAGLIPVGATHLE